MQMIGGFYKISLTSSIRHESMFAYAFPKYGRPHIKCKVLIKFRKALCYFFTRPIAFGAAADIKQHWYCLLSSVCYLQYNSRPLNFFFIA